MFYILQWSYEPNTASENRMQAYLKAMDELGFEATVVYLYPGSKYEKNPNEFKHIRLIYYWNHYTPYRGFFRKFTFNQYMRKFLKLLKRGDIVYTYHINKLISIVQGINGVHTFAEMTEHPKASDGIDNPVLYIKDEERISIGKKLDGLIVISDALRQYFVSEGLDIRRVHVINMLADASRFIGLSKSTNCEKYIAYCGNASNNKDGVDELIKAFSLVAKKHDEFKLYLIGKRPGIDDNSGNLELVRELGVEEKVKFVGLVPSDRIPQLLTDATILALDRPDSLQAKYGFPTKLGEYLLTKNPVVVTKVGDIPLFLTHKFDAMLAEERNPRDFADSLNWIIEHPDDAMKIGSNGFEAALRSFNSTVEVSKLIANFQNITHE